MRKPKQGAGSLTGGVPKGIRVAKGGSKAPPREDAHSTDCATPVQSHARARAGLPSILEALRKGTPITHAVDLARVPRQSLYDLKAADPDVAADIAEARATGAEAYRGSLVSIASGGEGNANVLLHLMERLYPDDYAPPKQRTEVTGAEGKPQEHVVTVTITREEALSLARKKE